MHPSAHSLALAVLVEVETSQHLRVNLLPRCRVRAVPLDVRDDAQQVVAAGAEMSDCMGM